MNYKPSHEIALSVPFHDLDPMQVVWHGNYLKYFDRARAGLFDSLGVDLYTFYNDAQYLFPVTKTFTKHIRPLVFRDEIICKATLVEVHIKIVVNFEIRLASDGTVCTKGRGEQVAVTRDGMKLLYKIPDEVKKALGF